MEKIENKQLAYEEPLLEVVHLTEKDIITINDFEKQCRYIIDRLVLINEHCPCLVDASDQ